MSDKALLQGWFHCDTPRLDGVIVIFADSSVGRGFDLRRRKTAKLKRSSKSTVAQPEPKRLTLPGSHWHNCLVIENALLIYFHLLTTKQIKLRSGQNLQFQFLLFILFTLLHTTLFTSPQMIQPSGHSRIAKLVFLAAFEWPNSTISPFFKGTGSAANLKTQDVNAKEPKEKHILTIQLSKKSSGWHTYYIWLHCSSMFGPLEMKHPKSSNIPCNPNIFSHPRNSPTRNLGPWRSPRQVTFRPNS